MHEVSHHFDDMEDTEFPTFPVVFQPEPLTHQSNRPNKNTLQNRGNFSLPQSQMAQLKKHIQVKHETIYPELFKQTWANQSHIIDNFFQIYRAINDEFVKQMIQDKHKLKIVRISSHKMYIGEYQNDSCNGRSIIIFKNGNLYEGMMDNNKRQGQGAYVQSGIGYYEGTFKNDLKNDSGLEVFYKKWGYQGNFVNGLRHQKGLYIDKTNNITYYGLWKLGIMHGKGKLQTSASVYNGFVVNSLKHGNGQEQFTNGDSYKGEYQNNRFDGFGTYCWKHGQDVYEGHFKNGMRHGKGKWSSGETKYSGNYAQGLKEGYGELYYPSGNFYKGNFIDDKREGYGEMFWTDGSFYKGDWKAGVQNGKGHMYLVGGEVISGLFQNSILVQITPSIYEKQMEISSMGIQDLFGSNQKLENPNKTRTFSQSKNINVRKKLTKIQENFNKKGAIKDNIYFKSPAKNQTNRNLNNQNSLAGQSLYPKSPHGNIHINPMQGHRHHHGHSHGHGHGDSAQGHECKCIKRLQNFRMRQKLKTKLNESKVINQSLSYQN